VLTSIVAVIGWMVTRRTLGHERRERADQAERAQASRVVAWTDSRLVETRFSYAGERPDKVTSHRYPHVVVTNTSDLPVFDVEVTIAELPRRPHATFPVVPPLGERAAVVSPADGYLGGPITVSFAFRDADERVWRRGSDGRLEPGLTPTGTTEAKDDR
jgi:hypothetical protein